MKKPPADKEHVLEGYGPLDVFLAKQRYKIAHKKLLALSSTGRILDMGCGSVPLFLSTLDIAERYGLDRNIEPPAVEKAKARGIELASFSIEKQQSIPFDDGFFDAVTMLAVFEHIEPKELVRVHREIRRILKPGGLYVMTTPAFWTDPLLRFLAKIRLISDVSIKEHKDNYRHSRIAAVLEKAGFAKSKMQFGYFELFMNNWATATK